jgi:hypothetical protein
MARFLILYNSGMTAKERMESSTPEEMQAGMEAWMKWKDELDSSLKFEFGMPLALASHLNTGGAVPGKSSVGGYSIIEGDKDKVVAALEQHPHLRHARDTIDLLEMLPMPGIES